MTLFMHSVAAATCVAGYDILDGTYVETSPYRRRVKAIYLAGNDVAEELKLTLKYGDKIAGTFEAKSVGNPTLDKDDVQYNSTNLSCPAHTKMSLTQTDANGLTTDPCDIVMNIEELPRGRRRYR